MKQDKRVVDLFLAGYAKWADITFVNVHRPDETIRDRKAVDAIGTDLSGKRHGVEHTILPPFSGQKEALSGPLARVFEPLTGRPVPGCHIWVKVPDNCIKIGQDWSLAATAVASYFEGAKENFPIGWSDHTIPGTDPEIPMTVNCQAIEGYPGSVSVTYVHPGMEKEFADAVKHSVTRKLGKLIAARSDRRILLFEKEWLAYSPWQLADVINSLLPQFPDLARVDEVWLAETVFLARDGYINFHGAWPEGNWLSSAFFRTDRQ